MDLNRLIRKYSKAGPRYTSYPTAPQWSEQWGQAAYADQLSQSSSTPSEPLGLYVHIPFCESLCYYCGCNIQITKDHSQGRPYISYLLKELESVAKYLENRHSFSQISWGGGTPTFLSTAEIETLHEGTRKLFDIAEGAELSIEVDPRVTTSEQLRLLRKLGFNRISLGVQDFDPEVQKVVHRVQSVEMTERMLGECRELGFKGINFDFIYGLPLQTPKSFERTIDEIVRIRPDRIALYNYAHLPSLRPHQRILEKLPMPTADDRIDIFTMAYDRLIQSGYRAIGMDHFALETDELYQAIGSGSLYRNFMGYTVKRGAGLIGVGASAIGELGNGYFQNIRETLDYQKEVDEKGFATFRGCQLTLEDVQRKWIIQNLMCRFDLNFDAFEAEFHDPFESNYEEELTQLQCFYDEGILERASRRIHVTPLGRLFLRNVAMVFDAYLQVPKTATYSQTV